MNISEKKSAIDDENKIEIADILEQYLPEYLKIHNISDEQYKAIHSIVNCRKGAFGYRWEICEHCGHMETANNSCQNRHCPKCNYIKSQRWINARLNDLLPIDYHHSVFTLPHDFNKLSMFNEELFYDLLFETSSDTLLQFGEDPKWLGAKIGFYGILHTWGGKLWRHLHVHYITTAGGLTESGEWLEPTNKSNFLFPVQAMSIVFRAKFIKGLLKAHSDGKLNLPGELARFNRRFEFEQWLYHEVPKKWNVYSKPPFSFADDVVKYLGRYTHGVAISNHRIISLTDGMVEFYFKNTKNNCCWEKTKLSAVEFIRRFLTHILPNGFHRIRYYGFLSNGKAKKNIEIIREILADRIKSSDDSDNEAKNEIDSSEQDSRLCSECQKGYMRAIVISLRSGVLLTVYGMFHLFGQNEILDTS